MTQFTSHNSQKAMFLAAEGDQWFDRNQQALSQDSQTRNFITDRIARAMQFPEVPSVLEIGCAAGTSLSALASKTSMVGHGIDPSSTAIEAGNKDFPFLSLKVGTADALPYLSASFDVVWFGFCLYLLDRRLLQKAVSEADRVLKDVGLLVIVDFDPGTQTYRPYVHSPGLFSYKMNYSDLFLANPAYCLAEKSSFSHENDGWHENPDERVGITMCRKNIYGGYSFSA